MCSLDCYAYFTKMSPCQTNSSVKDNVLCFQNMSQVYAGGLTQRSSKPTKYSGKIMKLATL